MPDNREVPVVDSGYCSECQEFRFSIKVNWSKCDDKLAVGHDSYVFYLSSWPDGGINC